MRVGDRTWTDSASCGDAIRRVILDGIR